MLELADGFGGSLLIRLQNMSSTGEDLTPSRVMC